MPSHCLKAVTPAEAQVLRRLLRGLSVFSHQVIQ